MNCFGSSAAPSPDFPVAFENEPYQPTIEAFNNIHFQYLYFIVFIRINSLMKLFPTFFSLD